MPVIGHSAQRAKSLELSVEVGIVAGDATSLNSERLSDALIFMCL
jgi:hypothetical protein